MMNILCRSYNNSNNNSININGTCGTQCHTKQRRETFNRTTRLIQCVRTNVKRRGAVFVPIFYSNPHDGNQHFKNNIANIAIHKSHLWTSTEIVFGSAIAFLQNAHASLLVNVSSAPQRAAPLWCLHSARCLWRSARLCFKRTSAIPKMAEVTLRQPTLRHVHIIMVMVVGMVIDPIWVFVCDINRTNNNSN